MGAEGAVPQPMVILPVPTQSAPQVVIQTGNGSGLDNVIQVNAEMVNVVYAPQQTNVYANPNTGSHIGLMQAGDTATPLGRTSDATWIQIQLNDGNIGWVLTGQIVVRTNFQ
jgi:uncharacterized protein YgiM (DUF1202 family)